MVGEQTQEGMCKEAAQAPARVLLLVLRLCFFCFVVPGAAWLKMLPGSMQSQVHCTSLRLEAMSTWLMGKGLILSAWCSTVGVGNGIIDLFVKSQQTWSFDG